MLHQRIVFGYLALALAGPAAASGKVDLAACRAMQAALVPRQAEIEELAARRAASAARAEEKGEAWEEAEIHRLVSPSLSKTADELKAGFEHAAEDVARDDLALQSAVSAFNADVAAYNTRCTRG
jgi:hypothetical protein